MRILSLTHSLIHQKWGEKNQRFEKEKTRKKRPLSSQGSLGVNMSRHLGLQTAPHARGRGQGQGQGQGHQCAARDGQREASVPDVRTSQLLHVPDPTWTAMYVWSPRGWLPASGYWAADGHLRALGDIPSHLAPYA